MSLIEESANETADVETRRLAQAPTEGVGTHGALGGGPQGTDPSAAAEGALSEEAQAGQTPARGGLKGPMRRTKKLKA